MLCPKCGAMIGDDSVFCSKCGAPAAIKPEEQAASTPEALPPPMTEEPAKNKSLPEAQPVNEESAPAVPAALPPPAPQPGATAFKTYLTPNILLTVFGFLCLQFGLPTAVTGLVFSALAQSAYNKNDIAGAVQHVKLAKVFMWISFSLEIATLLLIIAGIAFFPYFISRLFEGLQRFDFRY